MSDDGCKPAIERGNALLHKWKLALALICYVAAAADAPPESDTYAGVFFDSGDAIAVDILDSIGTQGHDLDSRRFLSHYDSTACVTIDVPFDPRPGQDFPALVVNPTGLGIPDGFDMGVAVATELRWLKLVGIVELSDSAIMHIAVTINDTIASVRESTGGEWWLSVFAHTSNGWVEGWTSAFADGAAACNGLTAVIPPRMPVSVAGGGHAARLHRRLVQSTGGRIGGSAVYRIDGTRVRFLGVEGGSHKGTGTPSRVTAGAGVLVATPRGGQKGMARAILR